MEREKESPCALSDRQQQGLWCLRHTIPYHHLLNCLLPPPPPTLSRGPAVKSTILPISLLTPFCAPSPTSHCSMKSRASDTGWMSKEKGVKREGCPPQHTLTACSKPSTPSAFSSSSMKPFSVKSKKKKINLLFLLHPTLWHRLAVGEGTGGKLIVAATDQKDQSSTTDPSL